MDQLAGQRIVVTGGGSGIGLGVSIAAARAGAQVMVAGRRKELLDEAVRMATAEGLHLVSQPADLADEGSVEELTLAARDRWGGVDGLVNAAAVAEAGPSAELRVADIERSLRINLVGAAHVTRSIGQMMVAAGTGSIVQIGSVAGEFGIPGRLAYVMAKHGLNGLVRTLATEWGPAGVRVNGVNPHLIRTPIMDSAIASGRLSDDRLLGRIPLRRYGRPQDVAAAAVFLLSDAAGFITGHTLTVDGGWTAGLGLPDPE